MLAAFPPPGLATPSLTGTPRQGGGSWPPPFDNTSPAFDEKSQRPRRRCCGLPVWGFLLLLLIILIVIAAAVVVPIELLVIHKQKSSTSTSAAQLQQCQSDPSTECKNGGSSILSGGGLFMYMYQRLHRLNLQCWWHNRLYYHFYRHTLRRNTWLLNPSSPFRRAIKLQHSALRKSRSRAPQRRESVLHI